MTLEYCLNWIESIYNKLFEIIDDDKFPVRAVCVCESKKMPEPPRTRQQKKNNENTCDAAQQHTNTSTHATSTILTVWFVLIYFSFDLDLTKCTNATPLLRRTMYKKEIFESTEKLCKCLYSGEYTRALKLTKRAFVGTAPSMVGILYSNWRVCMKIIWIQLIP